MRKAANKKGRKLSALGRFIHFLRHYRYFSAIILASAVALGLEFAKYHTAAHWLLGSVAIIATFPLLKDMWGDLRSGSYGIDILAITAIVASVWLGEYWTAAVIVIMLTGGEALEDYAEHRAKSELESLLKLAPQVATVLRGRKSQEIAVDKVQVGDKLIIKPGDIVPVDMQILEGTTSLDESALTGESLPVSKAVGDTLLSGAINIDGAVTARCIHQAKDSQYEQIIKLVRAASNSQAPFVRLADRYSVPFTALAYAIAGSVWFISQDPRRFLEVIVVATPCPLLLAAPIAIISGMSRASRLGIIIKTGSALERLAAARSFAFDKTGTLTTGELSVAAVTAVKPFSQEQVLALAASLEQHSNHAVANAIVAAADQQAAATGKRQLLAVTKIKHFKELAGQGLAATIKNQTVLVGRDSFLQANDIEVPKAKQTSDGAHMRTYVAIGGQFAGTISLHDQLRDDAKPTLEALRKLGYRHLRMVTGDNPSSARAIAAEVGINKQFVTAQALPADKLRVIESEKQRPVVFVGDGVNDAPVLTAADVGIAIVNRGRDSGATAASESADIVILLNDLFHVAQAAAIAKRTFRIAMQSIFIGMVMSLGLMLVYATGKFSPLSGAIAQEAVDVFVIFNALRAHFGK